MIYKSIQRLSAFVNDRGYRDWVIHKGLASVGFNHTQWSRIAYERAWRGWFAAQPIGQWDALEISPGHTSTWRLPFRSYSSTQYPDFDICTQRLERQFDVIIADQIWEHLAEPEQAARNVFAMVKPGGFFIIATPFLVRVHGVPEDYSRWTRDGLRRLLARAGFNDIATDQWGNRKCVAANLSNSDWVSYGWRRDMRNEPNFPVHVWAFARRKA